MDRCTNASGLVGRNDPVDFKQFRCKQLRCAQRRDALEFGCPATRATSNAVITVDNGNGTGPVQLDRTINVVSGSGDPFGLGIGWAAGFTFAGDVIPVRTPCDGTKD